MQLPPLRSTAASERESISLSSPQPLAPPQQHQQLLPQVYAVPSAVEVLHLPILTATSLRPARLNRATPSAHVSSQMDTAESTNAEPHPLLQALLSNSVDDDLPPPLTDVASPLLSLGDAVKEVGGADKMERLLHELQDVSQRTSSHAADGSSAPAADDVVQRCVQRTLALPRDVVHVSGTEDDPSMLQVRITLPVSAKPSKPKGTSLRPCLLLRVHRQRGVLSLHVVNVRYDGPELSAEPHMTRRRLREPIVGKRSSTKTARTINVAGGSGPALFPSFVKDATTHGISPLQKAEPPLLPQVGRGLDYAELCTALGPSPQIDSGAARTDVRGSVKATASRSPSTVLEDRGGSRCPTGVRRTRKRRSSTHRSRPRGEVGEFDPLRPEETTPFNDGHRPLTFNAAIAFS